MACPASTTFRSGRPAGYVMSATTPTRVVLADDHWAVRDGVRSAIGECADFVVAGVAENLAETTRLVRKQSPEIDILVIDAVLAGDSAINAIPAITRSFPRLSVLVYSNLPEHPYAVHAIRQGAAGFVSKAGSRDELLGALRSLARGRRYISSTVAQLLAEQLTATNDLTARESEVVRYFADGRRCGEIAKLLSLSPKTVSAHKANAMTKLGLRSNADLIRWAIDNLGA